MSLPGELIDEILCRLPVNDDSKVVKIAQVFLQSYAKLAIVYSLKKNAWTWIQEIPSNIYFAGDRGLLASGSLHWMAIRDQRNCEGLFVGFDLELQQFKEVPYPAIKRTFDNANSRSLVDVGGYLCFLDYEPKPCMDVWLMNNSGAERTWSKALSVKEHGILGSFSFLRPVGFSKSGEDLLLQVDTDHSAKLVCPLRTIRCSSSNQKASQRRKIERKGVHQKMKRKKSAVGSLCLVLCFKIVFLVDSGCWVD
ncbi:hypothetical protein POM88_034231 [Heracleum sosnowskyi]|uniref:F-box protein n=1 Tax=Heracleum sosnowskyi TaxID=360622 RepID=A0AAD8HJ85_9APIA|nr:hypothetical protein POM88_034231 [Heracleum sosnowskyi]